MAITRPNTVKIYELLFSTFCFISLMEKSIKLALNPLSPIFLALNFKD